ncbi:MAG: exo-alpha-sialidase [Armatimonadota bacterium]|nr:exo-alpha-sialidase [Armatimonadota bacterium]
MGQAMDENDLRYEVCLQIVRRGYDGETCWVAPRAGTVPGAGQDGHPAVVMTVQKLLLSGVDVFSGLHDMRTDDLGRTWSGPTAHPELGRRREAGGVEAVPAGFWPAWHAVSGKLLGIGHVARYRGNRLLPEPRPRQTSYSVYDAQTHRWTPWQTLDMPDAERFFNCGAGSSQRVDLPDGTILLPVYFRSRQECLNRRPYATTVLRCAFDGRTLSYQGHGDVLSVASGRGLYEPSLTRFQGRWFLTMRHDQCGYVASGDDGLHFHPPRPWTFDDGADLGNYNTQQHWVTHAHALFLVYTRRGAGNDHVFRHRAPLFIGRVDPDRLCVVRASERVLVPERGARLGNFGVTTVNRDETWVTVAEWMQPPGCERYGSDNRVYAARIRWSRPNVV